MRKDDTFPQMLLLHDVADDAVDKICRSIEAARDGDPFAVGQLARVGAWLGEGIASITAVLDPAMVVIGGGVSEAGDLLLDPLRAAFERSVTGRGFRPVAEVRPAELGNSAGMIGAADLARRP